MENGNAVLFLSWIVFENNFAETRRKKFAFKPMQLATTEKTQIFNNSGREGVFQTVSERFLLAFSYQQVNQKKSLIPGVSRSNIFPSSQRIKALRSEGSRDEVGLPLSRSCRNNSIQFFSFFLISRPFPQFRSYQDKKRKGKKTRKKIPKSEQLVRDCKDGWMDRKRLKEVRTRRSRRQGPDYFFLERSPGRHKEL